MGDIDAVKATTLGFKNLMRVIEMLPPAVLKPGEDYTQFEHMYQAIWDQARLEVGHVANIIGGYDSEPKAGTTPGVRFTPIAKARQAEAVAFLNAMVFKTPMWLLPADVLRKIEPTSGQARVLTLQQAALNGILSPARLLRLQEHEAIIGDQAYTTAQMLADLRAGILSELCEHAGRQGRRLPAQPAESLHRLADRPAESSGGSGSGRGRYQGRQPRRHPGRAASHPSKCSTLLRARTPPPRPTSPT